MAAKILFDANVLLDYLLQRDEGRFTAIREIISRVEEGKINGYFSTSIMQTVSYIMGKTKNSSYIKTTMSDY